jgi:alkylated DNA nucleotide flippase Atl1
MATYGGEVPWYRVVRADGSCAEGVRDRQVALLREEGVPMNGYRVDLAKARWDGMSAKRPKGKRRLRSAPS